MRKKWLCEDGKTKNAWPETQVGGWMCSFPVCIYDKSPKRQLNGSEKGEFQERWCEIPLRFSIIWACFRGCERANFCANPDWVAPLWPLQLFAPRARATGSVFCPSRRGISTPTWLIIYNPSFANGPADAPLRLVRVAEAARTKSKVSALRERARSLFTTALKQIHDRAK